MKAQVLKQYDDDLTASSWVDLENVPDSLKEELILNDRDYAEEDEKEEELK